MRTPHPVPPIVVAAFALMSSAAAAQASAAPMFRIVEELVPRDARVLKALDVDLDGDEDLLSREGVLLNDGSGRFAFGATPAPLDSVLFFSTADVALDLDGDGDRDWIAAAPVGGGAGSALFAFLATPAGLAATTAAFPIGSAPARLAAVDYDGDGFDDLIVGGPPYQFANPGVAVWRNAGGGIFVAAPAGVQPAVGGAIDHFRVGDFDGDGDRDLFCADTFAGLFSFWIDGGSSFAAVPIPVPTSSNNATYGAVGDFDGDGSQEVYVRAVPANSSTSTVFMAELVGGSAVFAAGAPSGLLGTPALVAADFDGDGVDDLATGFTGPVAVPETFVAAGTNFLAAAPPAVVFAGRSLPILAFDADGDGDRDLLLTREGGSNRIVFSGQTGGMVEPSPDFDFAIGNPFAGNALLAEALPGDFDGDGDVDLARVVRTSCSGTPAVRIVNDGRGRFSAAGVSAFCGAAVTASAVADFNADGRDDLFTANFGGVPPTVEWHRALANGTFATTVLASESGVFFGVLARDLDGDGDPDGAVWTQAPSQLIRYLRTPTGFARTAIPLSAPPQDVRAADVTGDGVPDFVVTTTGTALLVDGATLIAAPLTSASGSPLSGDRASLADFDGDGAVDVLLDDTVRLNVGSSLFSLGPILPGFPQPVAGPGLPTAAHDFDSDGHVDVLAYGALWRGVAGGSFVGPEPVPFPRVGVAQTPVMPVYRAADFDRDGDLDLVDPAGRLVSNVSRHLARGTPAAPGRTATFDAFGPPLEPFDLFAAPFAFQQNPIAVPGFGNLFLVPSVAAFVGTFAFDASGTRSLAFLVPNAPALVGFQLHWQAVLPVAGRLTNVETTTVLAL